MNTNQENNTLHSKPATEKGKPPRVVVMTGATSGLGVYAVQRIAAQPNTRVIIGARGSIKAVPQGIEIVHLDLASLTSVREFASAVIDRLGKTRIDILILNAGVQNASNDKMALMPKLKNGLIMVTAR